MIDTAPDWAWGNWMLGDLADALRRACEVVGHGSEVIGVQVVPPATSEDFPAVTIVVAGESALAQIRSEVGDGAYAVRWIDHHARNGWAADVAGVRLVVETEAGEPR